MWGSVKTSILQAWLNGMAIEKGPQMPVINVILLNNFGMYLNFANATPPLPAVVYFYKSFTCKLYQRIQDQPCNVLHPLHSS